MEGIYGLSSSRDRKIVYVGLASDLARRDYQHRYHEQQSQLKEWLRRERHFGFDLEFNTIEYCGKLFKYSGDLISRETYWMDRIRPRFNNRKNWWQKLANSIETTAPQLSQTEKYILATMKESPLGYVENWLGYVGIRYHHYTETCTVRVQSRAGYVQLKGDGGSCVQMDHTYRGRFGHTHHYGDWHFRDYDRAIEERNRLRLSHLPIRDSWPEDNPRWQRDYRDDMSRVPVSYLFKDTL